eukprot:COSAG01_NODE_27428_length_686_cov_0.643952_1_plen_27_part_01
MHGSPSTRISQQAFIVVAVLILFVQGI